jgi:hypothetical protein
MKYVAWIDTMGAASIMSRSMGITANFLGKLHTAALRARHELATGDDLRIYPVVDGVYVTASRQGSVLAQLKGMIRSLALCFIFEENPLYHFMVRSCIAYGSVWEGNALMTPSHHELCDNPDYTDYILFGPAVAQAEREENLASPFGVWVHESARTLAPAGMHPLTCTHWEWWRFNANPVDTEVATTLVEHLKAYFEWCKQNSTRLLYPDDRIEAHSKLMRQYFQAS